jgi:exopolyphosphatase/guanosine-5'-triphosphate,3'-diphosphate pyrophosphatase
MSEKILSAIDLGTNSFHMIVVKVSDSGGIETLYREKENVRLGSGSSDYSLLTPDAIERGIACLKRFQGISKKYNAEIRAVATSAIREAENQKEFLEEAYKSTGIKIQVISGQEEARLIYLGILQGLPVFKERILLIDIGGGSTELLVGESGDVLFSHSFKMGAVRLTEKYFKKDSIGRSDIQKARFFAESLLVPYIKNIDELKPFKVITSSGTATTIASMVLAKRGEKLDRLNGFEYTSAELLSIRKDLNDADTSKKRAKLLGLEEKRKDIIVAGSVILEEIFEELGIRTATVSDYALREGILYDTISSWKKFNKKEIITIDNIKSKAIQSIQKLYPKSIEYSKVVKSIAIKLFLDLIPLHGLSDKELEYLEASASLIQVGVCISQSGYHKHNYYIIKNSDQMVGFSNQEIEIIAQVARYHRKNIPRQKHLEFKSLPLEDQGLVKKLASFLRIADALNQSGNSVFDAITAIMTKESVELDLKVKPGKDPHLELYSFEERKDLFEETFNKKIKIKGEDKIID